MKSVYIINCVSQSTAYGIGTYTKQLIDALKSDHIHINVVNLFDSGYSEVLIEYKGNVRYIHIPHPQYLKNNVVDTSLRSMDKIRYHRNVYYVLFPYIDSADELVFHFNYLHLKELAELLRENYSCKILLTLHYTHWSFQLGGDIKKLRRILKNPQNEAEELIREGYEFESEFITEYADHILAIAQHSADMLQEQYHIPPEKITVIPNGLKDSYKKLSMQQISRLKKQYHIPEHEQIVLFAGRLTAVKGVDYLIEAFKLLLKEREDVRLIIAGEGDFKRYHTLINPYWNKIILAGFVPSKQLRKLYRVADLGVVPSLHEEFGYVAVEMIMHGLPVIVNNSTGLAEIIQNKINGVYVHLKKKVIPDKQSVYEFSQILAGLLKDTDTRKKYGKKGRQTFLKRYDLPVFSENIKLFYHSTM